MDSVSRWAPGEYWASSCGDGSRIVPAACRTRGNRRCRHSRSNRVLHPAKIEPALAGFDATTQSSPNRIDFLWATFAALEAAIEISCELSAKIWEMKRLAISPFLTRLGQPNKARTYRVFVTNERIYRITIIHSISSFSIPAISTFATFQLFQFQHQLLS